LKEYEEWYRANPLRQWREGQEPRVSRPALAHEMIVRGYSITPATIQRWECGEYAVPDAAMKLLAEITGMRDLRARWEKWQGGRAR